jgi:hypothetical protein
LSSKVIAIKVMQEWSLTRLADVAIHDWRMFIKPTELVAILERYGLRVGPLAGLGPRAKLPTLVRSVVGANRGRITYGELSRRLNVGPGAEHLDLLHGFRDQGGCGVKRQHPHDMATGDPRGRRRSRSAAHTPH